MERDLWVLQLGYFSHLDNAQALRDSLAGAGYSALVVATGEPGEQRYRVIAGQEGEREALAVLNTAVEADTGQRGIVVRSPFKKEKAEYVFDTPQPRYLLAQAAPAVGTPGASPMRVSGYDTGLARTPQEEIDSMPGFTIGNMPVIPTLGLTIGYDDNVTMASSNEISSWFYMISPAIRWEIPTDHSVLTLTAAVDIVRYSDSSRDDRTPWYVRGDWTWDISTRQNLGLFVQYSEGTDRRGEGRRQGDAGLVPLDPDEWKRWGYGGTWDYGAVGARGRLTINAGAYDLEYTNNRTSLDPSSIGTRALDRDWWWIGGTFFWRVAPKTSLLADYRYTDTSYDEAVDSDSEVHVWALGVTWDATAKTSGRIQYGNQKRRFDDPTKEDYSGPAWMASIDWRPRTYSLFTLRGTRSTQEPNGNGDHIIRQDITLSWLHDWATRFGTNVDVGYGQDKYKPDGRTDDLWYWGVGARYTYNQHVRLGGSITGYHRDSDEDEFSYDRIVYMLTAELSF